MIALSIRQPWAWLIVHGPKDIENREWRTHYRGRFLVHAAKQMSKAEYLDCIEFVRRIDPQLIFKIPKPEAIERGGFVGDAELWDCVTESQSPWFVGPFGFAVRKAKPAPFRPYTGQLGLFHV